MNTNIPECAMLSFMKDLTNRESKVLFLWILQFRPKKAAITPSNKKRGQ